MVSADFEKIWPEAQDRLAALSTGPVRRLTVSQAGHAIAEEEPTMVAGVVEDLIVEPRPTARARRPSSASIKSVS